MFIKQYKDSMSAINFALVRTIETINMPSDKVYSINFNYSDGSKEVWCFDKPQERDTRWLRITGHGGAQGMPDPKGHTNA